MRHFSFPSIEQFRHVVKSVQDRATYHRCELPVITFEGTVKLHGTNASVMKDLITGEIWAQSRQNVITPEQDNAGFARYVNENLDTFEELLEAARLLQQGASHVGIFGEWCGQGINSGVAITQLPKMFVVFGIKRITNQEENLGTWFTSDEINAVILEAHAVQKIYSITRFKTFRAAIDFIHPELAQNDLVKITSDVEAECPVGAAFNVKGVGEGVVWRAVFTPADNFRIDGLIFKVKGPKHSDSKTTNMAPVDVEKIASIKLLAESVVTDHRLEKMIEVLKQTGVELIPESTGAFLKLVGQDVSREEGDTITASGFTNKEVMPVVSRLARDWYLKLVNKV